MTHEGGLKAKALSRFVTLVELVSQSVAQNFFVFVLGGLIECHYTHVIYHRTHFHEAGKLLSSVLLGALASTFVTAVVLV